MIYLLAKHPAWGAADNFYRAFKSCGIDVKLLCFKYDKFSRVEKNENIVTIVNQKNLIEYFNDINRNPSNRMIVFSPTTIGTAIKRIGKQQISNLFLGMKNQPSIFITGTIYLQNYKYWNSFLENHRFRNFFCEPELIRCNPKKNIPLFHPMEYNNLNLELEKNEKITISHAPGLTERVAKKGTDKILRVIDRLVSEGNKIIYDHIVGVPLSECLKRKRKSHIFIDQINPGVGGIGKNGLEAIALECIVFSSLNHFPDLRKTIYRGFPVTSVIDENQLYDKIIFLIKNREEMSRRLENTRMWNKKINYKSTVEYIFNKL